jgi:hypothetical protein
MSDHVDQVDAAAMIEMRAHLQHSFRYDTGRMSDEEIIATMDELWVGTTNGRPVSERSDS